MYKARSADELLRILNYVRFLWLRNGMKKSKNVGTRKNEKGYKGEWGFFVDKENVEDALSRRFLLKAVGQENNRDTGAQS